MNGFRTARALVIDDVPSEAIPAIQALGKLGIACAYETADPIEDEVKKHTGVRLLVLDMQLSNRGALGSDPESDMGVLMGALSDLLEPRHDSLVAICWTKHKETAELLKKHFTATFPDARLRKVITVEKGNVADPKKLAELETSISEAFEEEGPYSIFRLWEQVVHDATTETTGDLYELSHSEAGKGSEIDCAFSVAAALAVAEGGSRLKNEKDGNRAVKAFADSLVPLLADRIEHESDTASEDWNKAVGTTLLAQAKNVVNATETEPTENPKDDSVDAPAGRVPELYKAKLNCRLNISQSVAVGDVAPGNIYLAPTGSANFSKFPIQGQTQLQAFQDTFVGSPSFSDDWICQVAVEITPPCDYAQGKVGVNKFCWGFVYVPTSKMHLRRNAIFLRDIGPMFYQNDKLEFSHFSLVLNCHYTFSTTKKISKKLEPFLRLRSAPLKDLIAWQATQSSRPGFVQVN